MLICCTCMHTHDGLDHLDYRADGDLGYDQSSYGNEIETFLWGCLYCDIEGDLGHWTRNYGCDNVCHSLYDLDSVPVAACRTLEWTVRWKLWNDIALSYCCAHDGYTSMHM